jgi:EF-P beta-lysylation protein EpmB
MSSPEPFTVPVASSETSAWRASLRDAVRTLGELLELLELGPHDVTGYDPSAAEFPLLVPRGFVARMRKGDARDPLLRQVLPDPRELHTVSGFSPDPLRESPLARGGVLKKYAGRLLLITTAACPVHCRYCFRRHFPYRRQRASANDWSGALETIKRTPDAREIILSGGDPLSLTNRRLERLLLGLEPLDHVTTLRIHSRFPVILPERVDHGLAALLGQTRLRCVLVVHSNHAQEIDSAVEDAMRALSATGTLLLNQSVLLRGINDEIASLEALSHRLFAAGVLPYYLHLLDPVAGTAHYEVDAARGRALITALRARLPGYLVPALVREVPGELSKTPIAELLARSGARTLGPRDHL